MGRAWQPHESHLPYLLQLKIDFNLSGMGWLRLSTARFRWGRCSQHSSAGRMGQCTHWQCTPAAPFRSMAQSAHLQATAA